MTLSPLPEPTLSYWRGATQIEGLVEHDYGDPGSERGSEQGLVQRYEPAAGAGIVVGERVAFTR